MLLEVRNLCVEFQTTRGPFRAIEHVDLDVEQGEILGIVGESGSGKSVTMLAVMGLLPWSAKVSADRLQFAGQDLLRLKPRARRRIVGAAMAMIFQEPMTSLNPSFTVGFQIMEALAVHVGGNRRQRRDRAVELLTQVGIPAPAQRIKAYPHQLSGGMSQRVMIAMAIACNPRLLIADEPTTALDVTIQAQILELMRKLQEEIGMSILFITHDLGVVAEVADRAVVMYAGRAVEEAHVNDIFADPKMPYTLGLLNSIPRVDRAAVHQERLQAIPGNVPNPLYLPEGCAFHPRCRFAQDKCKIAVPELENTGNGHMVRCVRWDELDLKAEIPA